MIGLLPNDSNQKATQESTYIQENVLEINDIYKLREGIFPINLKTDQL